MSRSKAFCVKCGFARALHPTATCLRWSSASSKVEAMWAVVDCADGSVCTTSSDKEHALAMLGGWVRDFPDRYFRLAKMVEE